MQGLQHVCRQAFLSRAIVLVSRQTYLVDAQGLIRQAVLSRAIMLVSRQMYLVDGNLTVVELCPMLIE